MPETETVAETASTETQETTTKETTARTVPLSELQKERREKQALAQQIAERDKQDEERRQAELSESERLKEQLAQAETRAQEAETRARSSERRGWVRDAAAAAGFIDPGDAVAQIDVSDLDSETAAREAVAELKGRKPHLAPDNSGAPELKKVLQDGQRPEDKTEQAGKLLSRAELDALTPEKVNELDSAQPGLIDRSYAALAP